MVWIRRMSQKPAMPLNFVCASQASDQSMVKCKAILCQTMRHVYFSCTECVSTFSFSFFASQQHLVNKGSWSVKLGDPNLTLRSAKVQSYLMVGSHLLPPVRARLHHFMLDIYKKDLKGRKAIEESILAAFNLKAPVVSEAPDEEGDEGFLEEFSCPVSGELAVSPCCLSSGTIVSAHCVPRGGFKKDPNRLVACGLHGQAPIKSEVLELMIRTKFPSQYKALEAKKASVELVPQPTCGDFAADEHVHLGLGCDGCGLWPIRGAAYEDVDCRSSTGFHLCQACYDLGYHKRVLGGRFNQGHMPKNSMSHISEAIF
ncbi:unnamed protein product [Effrenium voratum]|nr:unnamed protein product [Effrenium voratum]